MDLTPFWLVGFFVAGWTTGWLTRKSEYALPLESRFQLLRARVETIDAKVNAHFRRIDKQLDIQECFECGEQISKPGHVVDGKLTCR